MSSDEGWVRFSADDPQPGRVDPEKMKVAKERRARGETPYDPDWGSPTTAEDIAATLADPHNQRMKVLLGKRRA